MEWCRAVFCRRANCDCLKKRQQQKIYVVKMITKPCYNKWDLFQIWIIWIRQTVWYFSHSQFRFFTWFYAWPPSKNTATVLNIDKYLLWLRYVKVYMWFSFIFAQSNGVPANLEFNINFHAEPRPLYGWLLLVTALHVFTHVTVQMDWEKKGKNVEIRMNFLWWLSETNT